MVSAASSGVVLAGLWEGVGFGRLSGSLPGAFGDAEQLKKCVFCVIVVKFWVFGSTLESLKSTPEIADSRGELLQKSMKKLV